MIWKQMRSGILRLAFVCALLAAGPASAQVDLHAVGTDRIHIEIDGQPFSDFFIGGAYGKPFLAPLRSASGLVVTRRYPMENVGGESRDHPHHRGLWIGYGNVNGINFWENELDVANTDKDTPKEQGRVALSKLDGIASGEKSGKLSATFEWQTPQGALLLEERRAMTFYADPELRIVDVDATFTAKTDVNFADTKEGFFAIRVADSMAGKNGGTIINAQGLKTEKNAWGKRADWVDYAGNVDGRKVGIAIFDHPGNYSHPPRWHVRDYGLFAVNPFGLKDFEPNARATGGHALAMGQSLRFRYRVIVHDGDAPQSKIAAWYREYAGK